VIRPCDATSKKSDARLVERRGGGIEILLESKDWDGENWVGVFRRGTTSFGKAFGKNLEMDLLTKYK